MSRHAVSYNRRSHLFSVRLAALISVIVMALFLGGCEIAGKMYTKMKEDVQLHMFPEDIRQEVPPQATDTYICNSARQLMIYKNEDEGTVVAEYEGRAEYLERVAGTKDEIYKNSRTTLRFHDDGKAEMTRQKVSVLENCKRVYVEQSEDSLYNN